MAWHKEFKVKISVDGDEGTIYCNSPELFEYFSERTPFPNTGGHGFPMAIYDSSKNDTTIYWVSATEPTKKDNRK